MEEETMIHKRCRSVKVCVFFLLLIAVPLAVGAQQAETQFPLLLSTGLPATETPEEILPTGAVVYLRANNLQVLLKNIDSLLTSFVPEKALPPELQPIFAGPQPFITFFGMQMFGQAVELSELSNLIGIALDRPVSLALYPMPPDKGFVLSVPIAHPTVVTGMAESILRPESLEQGSIGDVSYYRVVPSNPDLPREVYVLASEKTAFFCGSLNIAQMLVNSDNMGTITIDPVMEKGLKKYENRDLILVAGPGFLKSQLLPMKEQFAQVLVPVFLQAREGVQQIPPAHRLTIDTRLRLQFGIDGIDQLVDYAEAYSSGIYRVLLDKVVALLTNLDGIALSVDFEEKFQNIAFTLFSQDIQSEKFTAPLPLDEVKQALNVLPGNKSTLIAAGQAPEASASIFFTNILNAIEEELQNKSLPMDGFLAFKEYYLAKQHHSPLKSKVGWTLKTLVPASVKIDFSQFNTLGELLKYGGDRLSAGPFLVSMTLMPSVEEGLIENHFADEAKSITQNEQNYRKLREKLTIKQPFFDLTGRFQQEDMGADLKKLIMERVYTTRRGFFGYQQHEFINRRIMLHQKKAKYEVLYDPGADAALIKTQLSTESHPVPEAAIKLIDQTPAGTNMVSLFRTLHVVSGVLDVLSEVEELIHREMDTFLVKAQELVDTSGEEEFDVKLLEAKVELPLLLASLHLDENGKVYCVLPGELHYPRPLVIPKVKELFTDFLAAAHDVGGSVSFIAVQPGEFEISSVQSTEALALLGKTAVNNFYDQYMSSPEGMQLLMTTLAHPADFQDLTEEQIFINPFWEAIMEGDGFPLLTAIQRSKRSRTIADMRALGTAFGSHQVDFNYFPQHSEATEMWSVNLPKEYYAGAYMDAWETPFVYLSDESGTEYLLISYGKDRMPGRGRSEFDADIIYMNGQFIAPEEITYGFMESELNAALILAVNGNAVDIVQSLLESGTDPNAVDQNGQSALSLAETQGYAGIVELLKNFGAIDD